jgi:hypothetical protein
MQIDSEQLTDPEILEVDTERLTDPRPKKKNSSGGLKFRDGVLGVGVLLIIGGVAWYIIKDKDAPIAPPMIGDIPVAPGALDSARDQLNQPQAPQPQLTDADLAPVAPPESLDASDAQVTRAVEEMSPPLLAWLTPKEQIRKWVSMSVNLSDGELINTHRPVSYSMGRFKVKQQGERLSMSSANFERARDLIAGLTSVPPQKLAAYYRQWSPVLEDAYTELGMEGNFHGHFVALIDQSLAVPSLSKPPTLEQPHVLYTYADEEMEAAPDLNKLMWRLGPDNMAELQGYLLELKTAL